MTASTTAELMYGIKASMLKIVHSEPFSSKLMKVRIFILQMNNRITDAVEASEERKIRYDISLLRGPVAE